MKIKKENIKNLSNEEIFNILLPTISIIFKDYNYLKLDEKQLTNIILEEIKRSTSEYKEEFNDSNTDAGEIGENHTVVAIYEVELNDNVANDFIINTKLRYKDVNTNLEVEVVDSINKVTGMSDDFIFASCVVEFALLLRDSQFKGISSYEHLIEQLESLDLQDDYHKQEFLELVKRAQENIKLNQ